MGQSSIIISKTSKALTLNKDSINFEDINSFPISSTIENKQNADDNKIKASASVLQNSNDVVVKSIKLLLTTLNINDLKDIQSEIDSLIQNNQ